MLDSNFSILIIAFALIIVCAVVVGVIDLMSAAFEHGPAQIEFPGESPRAVVAQVAAEHSMARIRAAKKPEPAEPGDATPVTQVPDALRTGAI